MSMSGGPVDRATLEDLAAASRILADQGVFDAAGHVSMRHPGHSERFLMSRSLAPQLITADDIMEFDFDCNAIDARGRNGFIERYLHGEIYCARPDVMAVAHSHSPSVIAFGLSNTPMRAMYHNAAFLAAGVPVFDIRAKFGTTDIVINTAAGLTSVDDDFVRMARGYMGTRLQIFTKIRLPHALPLIFGGMKISITLAVIGVIVAEFVAAQRGIGYLIVMANGLLDTPLMMAAIAALSAMGLALYGTVAALERLVVYWNVPTETARGGFA